MGAASPCPCATSIPRTYPPSIFFARSLPALRAFLGSSLPAPGGRTEGRGGTSATEAPTTEDRWDPRRVARVFACPGGRGADRAEGHSAMTRTRGDDPASTAGSATGDAGGQVGSTRAAEQRARRSHVPGDG